MNPVSVGTIDTTVLQGASLVVPAPMSEGSDV